MLESRTTRAAAPLATTSAGFRWKRPGMNPGAKRMMLTTIAWTTIEATTPSRRLIALPTGSTSEYRSSKSKYISYLREYHRPLGDSGRTAVYR